MKDAVLHQFCANAFNTHKLPPLMIGRYEIFGIRKNLSSDCILFMRQYKIAFNFKD